MNRAQKLILILLAALSAALFSGCAKSETVTETEESSSDIDEIVAAYERMDLDQEAIDAVDPKMPENLGTVNSLVYTGLSFEAESETEVTDEYVEKYMEDYLLPYYLVEVTDRAAENGDTVNIDYVGTLNGEEFSGGSYTGYDLVLGSGTFIEGFEEGLVGAEEGETRVLRLTFPENYSNTDLAGEETEFTVTVNSISRSIGFDEFDDEAADYMSDGEYPTAAGYLEGLRDYLSKSAHQSAVNSLNNNAVTAAAAKSDIEVTDEAIEWQTDVTVSNYEMMLETQGVNLSYYLYLMGTDYESFRETMRSGSEEGAKEVLLVFEVCDAENLTITDETKAIYCDAYGYTLEELDTYLDEENQEIAIKWYMAGQFIAEHSDVTFVEAED